MTSPSSRRATILALSGVTLVTAAAAPVASAMPADPPVRLPAAQNVSGAPAFDVEPVADSSSAGGFDISSAGLGAAGGGLLVLALAGGGLVLRRPATRRHRPAGA